MIRILVGLLGAALVATAVLGWQVKAKNDRISVLSERNNRLNSVIDNLTLANQDLATQLKHTTERHQHTLTIAAQAEHEKRLIAADLDKTHADLRRALATERDWAETPMPGSVAAGVNSALDRLRNAGASRHHEL